MERSSSSLITREIKWQKKNKMSNYMEVGLHISVGGGGLRDCRVRGGDS